jgi:hypothetical protein
MRHTPKRESSNIDWFEYFPHAQTMIVCFRGGSVYAYANVTGKMNEALMSVDAESTTATSALSVGSWIVRNLTSKKTHHPYKAMNNADIEALRANTAEENERWLVYSQPEEMMTRDELAHIMNGKGYDPDIDRSTEQRAKEAGLVIVYGASDDLMEFRGAISDEAGACGGRNDVAITKDGILQSKCGERDECPYFLVIREKATIITAVWCETPEGPSWSYKTTLPHSTFELHDGDEFYCRGIVFEMKDVAA